MELNVPRRIERWVIKTDPDAVCELLKKLRGQMENRQAFEQALLVEMETKAKTVLNGANVPTIMYPHYLNFAREVHSRRKRFAGPSLAREVGVLPEKWVAPTLDRSVLERIRDEAMSVGEPPAP